MCMKDKHYTYLQIDQNPEWLCHLLEESYIEQPVYGTTNRDKYYK